MIGDTDLNVSKLYGMLSAGVGDSSEGRTAPDADGRRFLRMPLNAFPHAERG